MLIPLGKEVTRRSRTVLETLREAGAGCDNNDPMDSGASQALASARNGEERQALVADEKRRALKAVLESETFARSDQLRSFLKYVGEMAIARCHRIQHRGGSARAASGIFTG